MDNLRNAYAHGCENEGSAQEFQTGKRGRYVVEPIDVIGPLTEEEDAALQEGLASLRAGKGIPATKVHKRLKKIVEK